jgi:DNA-directed RNA polymerase specialized sigma24 family protein
MDLNDGNAAAKTKFDLAIEEMGRRDFEEFVYVAKAYMNAYKSDYRLQKYFETWMRSIVKNLCY